MIIHSSKEIVSLIRNKKVCVVGPATSLVGSGAGSEIDKFDCVIRTNEAAFLEEDMHIDYGVKTDIVYLNNAYIKRMVSINTSDKETRIKNLISFLIRFEKKQVPFLVVKGERTATLISSAIRAFTKIKKRKLKLQAVQSAKQFMHPRTKNLWKRKGGGMFEPTLASFIISDIISLRPKLVYVTGMDFYTNSDHWVGSYNQDINQKREEVIRRKNHHILADIEYMKTMRKQCDFIKFDSILEHFLS